MNIHTVRKLLAIFTALTCLSAASPARSSLDGARLIGLAMHQEVGRNIYIGAIYYNSQIPVPVDIVSAAGPKTMEYRVVARRTSIRSLMGSMLLQGELATGTPPSGNTINFAGDLMAAVRGSLYAGDSLTISLDGSNTLVAALNGQKLASSNHRDVADYLLMGWVSERGPSQAFRHSILADKINSSLMSSYTQHAASAERIAAIKDWDTSLVDDALTETPTTAHKAQDDPLSLPDLDAQTNAIVEATSAQSTLSKKLATPAQPTLASDTESASDRPAGSVFLPDASAFTADTTNPAEPGATLATAEHVQLASLTLTKEMIEPHSEPSTTWEAVDAIEYTQRLAAFNHHVMRSVYAKIRYPKAAVRRNIEGKLELDLTVASDGSLLNVEVALTSGNPWLDKSAIKAAQSAFSSVAIAGIDAVSIAEYGDQAGDTLLIPVPISFVLTE